MTGRDQAENSGGQQPLQEVLIVRLGAIGDVVNALTLAAALKAGPNPPRIGWVVHDLAAALLENSPLVDRVHLWRRGSGFAGLRGVLAEVRRERYDLAIDLQRIFKSALLARLSGARRVLGWDRRRAKEGAWMLARERIAPATSVKHMVASYGDFARHLGIEPQLPFGSATGPAVLVPDSAAVAFAQEQRESWSGPGVVLNLGASKPANRWPAERFGALGHSLAAHGFQVILVGGPGDHEAAVLALAAMGTAEAINLVGQTGLMELAALLAHAELFIGCDTGPMHMAVAMGCRTLVLFGPANPLRTGPCEDPEQPFKHRVLQHASGGDWRRAQMASIEVDEVLAAALMAH